MVQVSVDGNLSTGQERLRTHHERAASVMGIDFEDQLTA